MYKEQYLAVNSRNAWIIIIPVVVWCTQGRLVNIQIQTHQVCRMPADIFRQNLPTYHSHSTYAYFTQYLYRCVYMCSEFEWDKSLVWTNSTSRGEWESTRSWLYVLKRILNIVKCYKRWRWRFHCSSGFKGVDCKICRDYSQKINFAFCHFIYYLWYVLFFGFVDLCSKKYL